MTHRRPTSQEKRQLRELFASLPREVCPDCGGYHWRACPRVKRKTFHPNGNIVEVEYWQDWDDSEVFWPEEIWDDEEEDNDDAAGPVHPR
jgi:hypothetical protein